MPVVDSADKNNLIKIPREVYTLPVKPRRIKFHLDPPIFPMMNQNKLKLIKKIGLQIADQKRRLTYLVQEIKDQLDSEISGVLAPLSPERKPVPTVAPRKTRTTITPGQRKKILALIATKLDAQEIADKFGISRFTVYAMRKKKKE